MNIKCQSIPIDDFNLNIFQSWEPGWYLLAAGDFQSGSFNAMTVSWGAMGIMWGKPFVQVVVRPARYTHRFMEKYPTFTLSAFGAEYRPALNLLGSKSGRNENKIAQSGLTPVASQRVGAPGFAEAELVIECEKMYYADFDPAHFLADHIAIHYNQDYHRIYYGEVKSILGTEKYRKSV